MTTLSFKKKDIVADIDVPVTSATLSDVLAKGIERHISNTGTSDYNTVVVAWVSSSYPHEEQPRSQLFVWLKKDTAEIKEITSLNLGGLVPITLSGEEVQCAGTQVSAHVVLWRRDSYTHSYNLKVDRFYNELATQRIQQLLSKALNPIK